MVSKESKKKNFLRESIPHISYSSKDSLRKNYCLCCRKFKDNPKKIKIIKDFSLEEFSKISFCSDCGTTLIRKNLFFDIGGGD